MNYAKLVNGSPVPAPRRVLWQGMQVFNPSGEKLLALGYKPVTYAAPQGEPPEGCVWAETWTETDEAILRGWQAVPGTDGTDEGM